MSRRCGIEVFDKPPTPILIVRWARQSAFSISFGESHMSAATLQPASGAREPGGRPGATHRSRHQSRRQGRKPRTTALANIGSGRSACCRATTPEPRPFEYHLRPHGRHHRRRDADAQAYRDGGRGALSCQRRRHRVPRCRRASAAATAARSRAALLRLTHPCGAQRRRSATDAAPLCRICY